MIDSAISRVYSNRMNKKTSIGDKLRELGISPSLLNWGDAVVSSTMIWFDEEKSEMCSDCGVSISVDDSMEIASILIDLEDAIIKHYKEQGIELKHSYV